jgi:nitronate monooxygenase
MIVHYDTLPRDGALRDEASRETHAEKTPTRFPLGIPVPDLSRWNLPRIEFPKFRWSGVEMPPLVIRDITARLPVVQGGMGVGISLSGLASAVAAQGGIGIIAANAIGMIEKDYFKNGIAANMRALRNEIRKARSRTDGLIGVNIMVAVNDFQEMLSVVIEEKVDLVFMGAGLPVKNIPVQELRNANVKIVPIVSSARATALIFRLWQKTYNDIPDAVVVEGPLAGGHLGFSEDQIDDPAYRLEELVPAVIEALKPYEREFERPVPVIAAGGVYTGEDIHTMLRLGASGVQMATRFVATEECDADEKFKQAYIDCTAREIGIMKSPVGMPGRAILNDFLRSAAAGTRPSFTCPWKCLASCEADKVSYCISVALNNARRGRIDQGFVFVGANAYRVTEIVPVAELVRTLRQEFSAAALEYLKPAHRNLIHALNAVKKEYRDALGRAAELKGRYEDALEGCIQRMREAGRVSMQGIAGITEQGSGAPDVSLSGSEAGATLISQIREEYEKTAALLSALQVRFPSRLIEIYQGFLDSVVGVPVPDGSA